MLAYLFVMIFWAQERILHCDSLCGPFQGPLLSEDSRLDCTVQGYESGAFATPLSS